LAIIEGNYLIKVFGSFEQSMAMNGGGDHNLPELLLAPQTTRVRISDPTGKSTARRDLFAALASCRQPR